DYRIAPWGFGRCGDLAAHVRACPLVPLPATKPLYDDRVARACRHNRTGNHMDSSLKQDTRLGQLTTPLGKDVLVLVRLDATEGLSELFEYQIEALSEKEVDVDAMLGRPCSVLIKAYEKERHFNGILV